MMMTVLRSRRSGLIHLALLSSAALTGACSNLLEVDLPGRVESSKLNDPNLANALVNGVVITFECAWTHYVAAANALSDQLLPTSAQGNTNVWGTRSILSNNINLLDNCDIPTSIGGYAPLVPLQTTRVLADNAINRLDSFSDAAVPNKAALKAQAKVYGAYATLALAEGFCEMAFDQGPILTRAQATQEAEARFTEAIALANAAASSDFRNMALVGRARARLNLANFAGARADAEQVPTGYQKQASRGTTDNHRLNRLYEMQNNLQSQILRHTSVAPAFRNVQWQGVPDPRVLVTNTGLLAADGQTPFWRHFKANGSADPVLIASHREARLIVAEAAARSGDLATARQVINALHAAAQIPGYDPGGTATQAEVIAQVIEERSRELFLEVGARFNDHLRFRGTPWNIPFRGEPGSVHPNGVDQRGQQYGTTTCIPLAAAELSGR